MSDRREFLAVSTFALLAAAMPHRPPQEGQVEMYGLIGKIIAVEGSRDELARVLLEGTDGMPGCLSYVVAEDPEDSNALWVTEVWESQASHERSLELPSVQEAIRKGRPMIAGSGERFVTTPLGGHGLAEG